MGTTKTVSPLVSPYIYKPGQKQYSDLIYNILHITYSTTSEVCSRPQRKAPSSTNVEAGVFLFYGHASLSTNMVGSLANGHIKEKLPDKPQA
jgi:hypothetical protein